MSVWNFAELDEALREIETSSDEEDVPPKGMRGADLKLE